MLLLFSRVLQPGYVESGVARVRKPNQPKSPPFVVKPWEVLRDAMVFSSCPSPHQHLVVACLWIPESLTSTRKTIPFFLPQARRLSGSAPDVLEVAVTLSEAVDAVVRLAHGADEAAESVGLGLAGESAVLIDLCDGDLDGTVVLGLDDAVGGAALAGDVTAACENMSAFLLCFFFCLRLCMCVSGVSLSVARERALGVGDGRTGIKG